MITTERDKLAAEEVACWAVVAEYHCGPDDDLEPDDDDPWVDCGLMPNGQCTKAGSEECDWECGRLG